MNLNVLRLHVYDDSQLIISQVKGEYKVLKPEQAKYHQKVLELADEFLSITFEKVSRASNGKADALARVAKELAGPDDEDVHITVKSRRCFFRVSRPQSGSIKATSKKKVIWPKFSSSSQKKTGDCPF